MPLIVTAVQMLFNFFFSIFKQQTRASRDCLLNFDNEVVEQLRSIIYFASHAVGERINKLNTGDQKF